MIGRNQSDCSDPASDCFKAQNLLDKYVDNELDEHERGFIDSHLSLCQGCHDGFQFESAFMARVHSLSPVQMPNEVREHIMLALGFPGISEPISGLMSAVGLDSVQEKNAVISPDNMGIPRGSIPRGEIPSSEFFERSRDVDPTD